MTTPSDPTMSEFTEYVSELIRVCPEAADGLFFKDPPPALRQRHRIAILRMLPDGAGIDALRAAWLAFVAANPSTVPAPGAIYEPDFYVSHGGGEVTSPPPAPITVDDYLSIAPPGWRIGGGRSSSRRRFRAGRGPPRRVLGRRYPVVRGAPFTGTRRENPKVSQARFSSNGRRTDAGTRGSRKTRESATHGSRLGHLTCVAADKGTIDCARSARTLMESFAAELGR